MFKLQSDFTNFSIQRLKEIRRKNLIFNEEYQRTPVWKLKQKQRLIDSILKGYTIGTLVLKDRGNKYEVLDGQQRLSALFDFLENKFKTDKLASEEPNKFFREIKGNTLANFIAFPIFVILIKGGEEQDIAEIFTRLQEGTPLNTAEKLNAHTVGGKMRQAIIGLTKNSLFEKIGIKNQRFSHREICANIALLELKSDYEIKDFPSLRLSDFCKMYFDCKNYLPKGFISKIKRVLNFIYKRLKDDAAVCITKKSDFIQLYLLFSYLLDQYSFNKEGARNFIIDFFQKVENPESRVPYSTYKTLRGKGQTKENLRKRLNIMFKIFKEKVKLRPLSENRLFPNIQKRRIYLASKGLCAVCNKKVNFRKAQFHHKKKWMEGGPTDIRNAAPMHPKCHTLYHKKHGYR